MKKRCSSAFKDFFRTQLLQTRNTMQLTQRQMADALLIAERSYAALESGEFGCSALTMALYLAYFCEDPYAFRAELKEVFETSWEFSMTMQRTSPLPMNILTFATRFSPIQILLLDSAFQCLLPKSYF